MNSAIELLNFFSDHARAFAWPMLWQSSLLILCLFALDSGLRRKLRPAVLHLMWMILLVKLLLPPSLAAPFGAGWWLRPAAPPLEPRASATVVVTYGSRPMTELSPVGPAPAPAATTPRVSTAACCLLLACCGSFGLFLWMMARWRGLARNMMTFEQPPEWLTRLLEKARRSASVGYPVRLKLLGQATSPAVCGLIRPTIVMPATLVQQLTPKQLYAILLHELMHLRRGDVWVNCIQTLLQVAYWWHPLLWLANARIRQVREEAVDEAVMMALKSDAGEYAPTLLQVAKLALRRPLNSLGLVGILESQSSLKQRIRRLVDFRAPRKAGLSLATLFILAFGAFAVPMGQAPAPESEPGSKAAPPPASQQTVPAPTVQSNTLITATLVREAKLLYEQGKLDEAESRLRTAIKQDPQNQAAYYYANLVNEARHSNTASGTNVQLISKGRKAVIAKLESIKVDEIRLDNVTLENVARDLTDRSIQLDPEKRGVNFIVGDVSSNRISSMRVRLSAPLHDISLAGVLEAVVKGSKAPIHYSIEDYGVVFAPGNSNPAPLHTHIYKLDENTLEHMREAQHMTADEFRSPGNYSMFVLSFLRQRGIDWSPPKSVFYTEGERTLLVRATPDDLEVLESALQSLTTSQIQVHMDATSYAVPGNVINASILASGPFHGVLTRTNQSDPNQLTVSGLLSPDQKTALVKTLMSSAGVDLLNEAAITTLAGRQTQIQITGCEGVITNLNPKALKPPGISAREEEQGGLYIAAAPSLGPTLDVFPTVQNDSFQIQCLVTATFQKFLGYSLPTNSVTVHVDGRQNTVQLSLPQLRVRQTAANIQMRDGDTLVMFEGTPTRPESATPRFLAKEKKMLVMLTMTITDATGNRLHRADTPPAK